MHKIHALSSQVCLPLLLLATACGSDIVDGGNENEVITTVTLTFTPQAGGTPTVFEFHDPDGDGGDPAIVDAIEVAVGSYDVAVGFENRLVDPPENISDEVFDESDEHQIFWTGSAVQGPASDTANAALTHAYDDLDRNGLPVGLENSITAVVGTGELTITLRHVPPINETPTKTATSASEVSAGGFTAIGGTSDAQVTFPVDVQ